MTHLRWKRFATTLVVAATVLLLTSCSLDGAREAVGELLVDAESDTSEDPTDSDVSVPTAEDSGPDPAVTDEGQAEPAVCLVPSPSPEDAAMCIYEAGLSGVMDAAARHATTEILEIFEQASQGESYATWEFSGCGAPILLDPPTGVSCTFYEPPYADMIHGVEIELGLDERDGVPFFTQFDVVG